MKAGNEARVGLVVIAALAILIGGYFALRGVGLGAQQYYLKLNGGALIAQGNDVRLQGVKVGVVQDVSLDPDTQKPLLTLAIQNNDPPFSLYRSYKYSVRSSGIIGENYVDIQGTPVSGDDAYPANDKSQLIAATSTGGLADVGERAGAIAGDMQQTLKKLNLTLDRINSGVLSPESQIKLVRALDGVAKLTNEASKTFGPGGIKVGLGDPQAQRALNATFINAALAANEAALAARDVRKLTAAASGVLNQTGGVMQQAGGVIGQAGGVIGDNRKQLNKLLVNLDRTTTNAADTIESVNFLVKNSGFEKGAANAFGSLGRAAKNIEDTTATFKGLADEQTQKDLRATLTAMRESTEALRDTTNSIKTFVADDGSQSQLRSTLSTLNTTASTLAETTTNLRDATAGIKNIFADEKLQGDVKAIPAELRRTLEATTATAERLNGFLGGRRRNRDATQTGSTTDDARSGGLLGDLSFTYRHLAQGDKRNFGDVRLQTEFFGAPFRIGLDEIGEGSKFTLQSGRFLGDSAAIRYGLYRSKLGVGADWHQGRFSLEGNLFDPNRRAWNVYGGVRLSPRIEVIIGRENNGSVRSNAVGVRLRP